MKKNDKRPKFLNLLKIHLPVTGIASINHRLSGVILFLVMPVSLYMLQLSVSGEQEFHKVLTFLSSTGVKLALVPVVWAFAHHLFAGFRFLLIDQNVGVSLSTARKTAWFVIVLAIIVTILVTGVWLL
jgi:succinate dehydrogenase / fumarate reductase cytochrome b subunit